MTVPNDKRRRSPVDRFRNILSAGQSKDEVTTSRKYPKSASSPGLNLPPPKRAEESPMLPSSLAPSGPGAAAYGAANRSLLPAFWTAASIISLVFNAIMLIVVVGLLRTVGSLNVAGLAPGLLSGLYTNFERMDEAHIKSTIPIDTNIPLNISVPVQTTTTISLARAVSIPGAHVKINTPLFNIDAPANVTLPAGTTLDVAMSFMLPVQADVPVSLKVPVDIPLQKTDLHPAVLGLQDTIRPLYCIVNPSAQSLSGESVCK
jgi:hypothetical protein